LDGRRRAGRCGSRPARRRDAMTSLLNSGSRMLLGAAMILAAGPLAFAQAEKKADEPKSKPAAQSAEADVADEQAAIDFARRPHPELATLLRPMKSALPKDYQKAVRELERVSDRLTRMETRSPERYAIELDLWKAEA